MSKILLYAVCLLSGVPVFGQSAPTSPAQPRAPEIVAIAGATLLDGSGGAPLPDAVVLVAGDSIKAVGARGKVAVPPGALVIDAKGLALAPGFIDIHNHSQSGLETEPAAATQVSQGITTLVLGPDGGSPFPVGEYLAGREQSPAAPNVATFVGHAAVRRQVMGDGKTGRAATAAEIERMVALVEQAMAEGALGLSTGLEYEVGKPATTEEVIALARAAGRAGGVYMSHIRDEGNVAMTAFAEAVRIGREARVPVQISHIKLGTVSVWGLAPQVIALVNEARRQGLDITADCYPYRAWHSTIRVIVPSGRHEDAAEVAKGIADLGGPSAITVVRCEPHPEYERKTLEAIAREVGLTPVETYQKIVKDGGANVVGHSMIDKDIRAFYEQPWVMVGSDGGIGARHPRGAGSFPRVLGLYVREQKWLTLPEAIRKMTSMPAARLGFKDRGLVRPGMKADLVLFDPARVVDRATFQEPQLIADGVSRVFVNGVEVWRDGAPTGNKPGRVLRHPRS